MNAQTLSESFFWEVTFDGTTLNIPSISDNLSLSLSDFRAISGGYFLPFDAMPGHDLTALLGEGDIGMSGFASASVTAVPEPGALTLFMDIAVPGVMWLRRRRV